METNSKPKDAGFTVATWESKPEYAAKVSTKKRRERQNTFYIILVFTTLILLGVSMWTLKKETSQLPAFGQGSMPTDSVLPEEQSRVHTDEQGLTWLSVNGKEVLLVNKQFGLPETYGDGPDAAAAEAYERMACAAADDGVPIWIVSGYRSYATQADIFSRNVQRVGVAEASRFSAEAGHSEHQTGLAFDIAGSSDAAILNAEFANTPQYAWLRGHAAEYGFILRYPDGKEWITGYIFEPWHYRYVGPELANEIEASGLVLEEFI